MFGERYLIEHIKDLKFAHAQETSRLEIQLCSLQSRLATTEQKCEDRLALEQKRFDERLAKAETERDEAVAKLIQFLADQSQQFESAAPANDGLPKADVDLDEDSGYSRAQMLRHPGLFARATTLRHSMKSNRRQAESAIDKLTAEIDTEARKRAQQGMAQQAQEHAETMAQEANKAG